MYTSEISPAKRTGWNPNDPNYNAQRRNVEQDETEPFPDECATQQPQVEAQVQRAEYLLNRMTTALGELESRLVPVLQIQNPSEGKNCIPDTIVPLASTLRDLNNRIESSLYFIEGLSARIEL